MLSFDPFALDRDIARGARASRSFLRALRRDLASAEASYPLESVRRAAGKSAFELVSSMPADDPLREPLRRWVFTLALVRIPREPMLLAARAWNEDSIRLEHPEPVVTSARGLVQRILRERVPEKRGAWLSGLIQAGPRVASAEKERDEARFHVASRLGVDDPWPFWLPMDRAKLLVLAREFLEQTDDLTRQLFAPSRDFSGYLELVLARNVRGSWPARPARFVEQVFDRTPLTDGLAIETGPMPEPLGASSLVRALARFGAAYARAAAPRHVPFVMAHEPLDLHPLRRGALFGSLLADPVFLRHALHLSRDEAREAKRTLARTLLGALRMESARSLVGDARTRADEVEELYQRALCVPFPRPLAHVLPSTSLVSPVRWLAAMLAHDDREELRSRFDEDWFRNPHALRHLREHDGTQSARALDSDALSRAPRRLALTLEESAS